MATALPIPTQAPPQPRPKPVNPYLPTPPPAQPTPWVGPQSLGGAAQGVFDLLYSAGQSMEGLDPVIPPGTPFGGLQRMGGQAADLLTYVPRQALMAPKTAADIIRGPLRDDLSSLFGAGYVDPRGVPELQPSAPLPGMPELLKRQIEETINPQGVTLGQPLTSLDSTTMIPGMPLPQAPQIQLPPDFKPDYAKADIRLDAARPQPVAPKGDKWGSFAEGLGQGAAAVDPFNDTWSSALAKVIGGGVGAQRELRLRQEEAEIRAEAEQRQYELMRAGVDEQRAANEAQMLYNRTKLEIDAYQQNFENQWKIAAALQPQVHANSDGSMIIQTRKQDGSTEVKKIGFTDALRNQLALAQTKAISGKSGEYNLKQRLLQNSGPEMALAVQLNETIGAGLDSMLIPITSPAYEKYIADTANFEQQLASQGLPDKLVMARATQDRFQRLMQLIYTNNQVRSHALNVLFGIQPPAQPNSPQAK